MAMKRRITRTVFALALALLCCGASLAAEKAKKPLETLSYQGLQTMLAANKGKVVVINFFATWCPPCREEIPGLMRIRKAFGEDKLLLIGASLDQDEKALYAYMDEMRFNYPVMKSGLDLARAAGVSAIPHLLIFDGAGEVAANQPGYVQEADLKAFLQPLLEKK